MGFCERFLVEIPNDGAVPPSAVVGVGAEVDVGQLAGKGYDYIRDGAAGFTGVLEGSVAGKNWATVVALAASAQGTVSDHFTRLRVTVTVPGLIGPTTEIVAAGRTQGP